MNWHTLKTLLLITMGTVLEYYDYALYGFSATFLATQFFPEAAPGLALLKTFGIFFIGAFSRPLGALFFGTLGDRYGRRIALQCSIVGITIPTLAMGLLPTTQTIGWLAPVLLLLCRLAQGIFTAGEYDGARIFIYESLGKKFPCLSNSIICVACMLGIYLASVVVTVVQLEVRWWRVPFLLGGVLGLLFFYFRFYLYESLEFKQYNHSPAAQFKVSLWDVLLRNRRMLVATVFLAAAAGGGYQFYLVFYKHYVTTILQLVAPVTMSLYVSYAILAYTLSAPVAGFFADSVGIVKALKWSFYGLCCMIMVNVWLLSQGRVSGSCMVVTASLMSFVCTPAYVLLFEQYSIGERYRCVSIGHAIGSLLFSGSTPLVSLWLFEKTQVRTSPLWYFLGLNVLGLIGLWVVMRSSSKNVLTNI